MWPFENPIRKKMKEILTETLQLKARQRELDADLKKLQMECPHAHKTVVVNESNEDWTSCEDCGKLLYR